MAITTTIAKHYYRKQLLIGVICVLLGIWGAFELFAEAPLPLGFYTVRSIKHQEKVYEEYTDLANQMKVLEDKKAAGTDLDAAESTKYESMKARKEELGKDGVPTPVGDFDRLTQWLFLSCLLFAPFNFLTIAKTKKRVYSLDDDGTLHMPEGTWKKDNIADIDMKRWMSKSIAYVVHSDGTRVMLDDYKHRNLHLIIGSIASRLHPEDWTQEAKPVKTEEPAADVAEETATDETADVETATASNGDGKA